MLNIKNITLKNFLSVGNISQAIDFNEEDLILVLGENLDLGGNDSRNGVGKTVIINAISYALYGEAIVKIKKDNLVNKVNSKNMLVSIEFEKNGTKYRIERGRRPNIFRLIVNGKELETTDEAQGENRATQKELERIIGISHDMFKQIVGLNTYNEPFLSMRSGDQRDIIEQLLGITKLTEKAEVLKAQMKDTKDAIKEEEYRIKSVQDSNKRIEQHIKSIKLKSAAWEKSKQSSIESLTLALEEMYNVDIDDELDRHLKNAKIKDNNSTIDALLKEKSTIEKSIQTITAQLNKKILQKTKVDDHRECPTCGHKLNDEEHSHVTGNIDEDIENYKKQIEEKSSILDEINDALIQIGTEKEDILETFYDDINDAYNHKVQLNSLANELEKEISTANPYIDQINELSETGLQEVSFDLINELSSLLDHQDFLYKLLTNKDSFIRKKIIDQNLAYLNNRLSHYLEKIGLPHEVRFKSDLEVEITQYGKDFDFDNLSRGERTRLILSLSWAFRDVYESLNEKINLMFIDELIDNGLDASGVENALSILKRMTRENKRNIFLISHRDELIGRVNGILKVVKESGFTSFSIESDAME